VFKERSDPIGGLSHCGTELFRSAEAGQKGNAKLLRQNPNLFGLRSDVENPSPPSIKQTDKLRHLYPSSLGFFTL
jgi:hypothetical protein